MSAFADLLGAAAEGGRAVGAFACYDLEVATAVLEAAESIGQGVIVLIPPSLFRTERGRRFAFGLRGLADQAHVPVALQLDHVADLDLIQTAFADGIDAVMADGSALPYHENVRLVQAAQELAHGYGAAVESELGHVEGNEDVAVATEAAGLTDPGEAARFDAATRADCLAVSIGNIHGAYFGEPRLDYARLDAIAAGVAAPLALHGASGLPDEALRRAIELGVRKINVNTELRMAYLAATQAVLPEVRKGADVARLHGNQVDAVSKVVARKLELLG